MRRFFYAASKSARSFGEVDNENSKTPSSPTPSLNTRSLHRIQNAESVSKQHDVQSEDYSSLLSSFGNLSQDSGTKQAANAESGSKNGLDKREMMLEQSVNRLIDEYGISSVYKCVRRKAGYGSLKEWESESSLSQSSLFPADDDDSSRALQPLPSFHGLSPGSLKSAAHKYLRKSRSQLRKSERIRRGVLDASFDPIFCINEAGVILTANHAAEEQFGWSHEEFIGQNISIITSGDHAKNHDQYIQHYLKTGQKRVMGKKRQLCGRRKDGSEFPLELGLAEIKTQSGDERMFCGFVRDLTRQKKDEEELNRKHEVTMGIIAASFDAMFTINETGSIMMANHAAVTQFGWSHDEFIGQNISMIVGGGHSQNHDEYIQNYLKTGIKRVMGKKRELKGRRKDGSEFSLELGVAEINTQSGNERMFCGFIRDLTRQKKDEEEVRRKHEVTMGIIGASFDAMFTINETGSIMMANHAAVTQFGWSHDEFIGQNISMIVAGGHSQNHDEYLQNYLKTGIKRVMGKKRELKGRRKDGSEFPLELGVAEINTQSGNERMFCGFIRDLTRQKKDEEEVRRKHEVTMGIIGASFDAMFTINETGSIIMANHAAVTQFGWSHDEFIGQNISMIVGGDRSQNHDEYLQNYLKTGIKRVMGKKRELKGRRKDGSEFPLELGVAEINTQSGNKRMFCGFIRDLTRQKKDEEEVRRKHEVTMGIIGASFDAMFTINETGSIMMANHAAVTQFGWSHDEFIGQNISMIVGGGHSQNHDEYLRNYLKTGIKRVMGKKRELKGRRKDGSEFPLELGLAEINTQSGDERMFSGFIRDLTRQKKDEEELKRQISICNGIIEASFDAMFAIDGRGVIQMVNQASTKKFGWSREEFMGQNISMIVEDKHTASHDDCLSHYIDTGVKRLIGTQREVEARRRDGTTFPVMLGVSEIKDQSGSHLFVAFIRDLTDEKEMMEMEIEKAEAEALLLNMLPENIAMRLREDPSHIADHHSSTTILFADIVGFTSMSAYTSPVDLVSLLNDLFSRFDRIVDKYDLNKVKTIGDCYMVTSVPDTEHQAEGCSHVCHFALDMMDELEMFNRLRPGHNLRLRVGINTGPVVAGVVGTKRFMYDLWGDAVNVASRMESTGIPGKIQVTKKVVDVVPESDFEFVSRGIVNVKGKGDMETFFLESRHKVPMIPRRPPKVTPPRLLRRLSAPSPFVDPLWASSKQDSSH